MTVFDPRVVDDWVAFWNNYDLSQMDRLFLSDEHVTYFSSEKQGIVRGHDALQQHHAGFGFVPGGKASGNRLWLEDVQSDAFADSAIVTAIWCFQRAGAARIQRGPVTLVYVATPDGWRIAHANFGNYPA
jgi:hypothetical protein